MVDPDTRKLKVNWNDFTAACKWSCYKTGDSKRCQRAFDQWRDCYNLERPHEGIDMQTPVTRYTPSSHAYPEELPEVVYLDNDNLYRVNLNGMIQFKKRQVKVTRGLVNERVAVRPLNTNGLFGIFYGGLKLSEINLNEID